MSSTSNNEEGPLAELAHRLSGTPGEDLTVMQVQEMLEAVSEHGDNDVFALVFMLAQKAVKDSHIINTFVEEMNTLTGDPETEVKHRMRLFYDNA